MNGLTAAKTLDAQISTTFGTVSSAMRTSDFLSFDRKGADMRSVFDALSPSREAVQLVRNHAAGYFSRRRYVLINLVLEHSQLIQFP